MAANEALGFVVVTDCLTRYRCSMQPQHSSRTISKKMGHMHESPNGRCTPVNTPAYMQCTCGASRHASQSWSACSLDAMFAAKAQLDLLATSFRAVTMSPSISASAAPVIMPTAPAKPLATPTVFCVVFATVKVDVSVFVSSFPVTVRANKVKRRVS